MKKREKILLGTTVLLGTALGYTVYKNIKQKTKLEELDNNRRNLLRTIEIQEAELLQKRGNMHFVKNCLSIIKSFAEEAEYCSEKDEYLDNVSRANTNTIKAINLIQPLLEHLTYATQNNSTTLFQELKHLKVFMEFVKVRSDGDCYFQYNLNDNVKPNIYHKICCCIFTEALENAYKHSYFSAVNNVIDIDIRMSDNDYLIYTVSNPVYKSKQNNTSAQFSGMGLKNLRERLALFYQNEFEIDCTEENSRFYFKLIIKLF